jgi:hypothetical protein
VPTPSSLRTEIVPPCASAIDFTIDRPRPVPCSVAAVDARKKALEELVDLVCRDADTRVFDLDHRRVLPTIHRERHRSPLSA